MCEKRAGPLHDDWKDMFLAAKQWGKPASHNQLKKWIVDHHIIYISHWLRAIAEYDIIKNRHDWRTDEILLWMHWYSLLYCLPLCLSLRNLKTRCGSGSWKLEAENWNHSTALAKWKYDRKKIKSYVKMLTANWLNFRRKTDCFRVQFP